MNYALEDVDLDILLDDIQRESEEIEKLSQELEEQLDELIKLSEEDKKRSFSKEILKIKKALEVVVAIIDKPILGKSYFFIFLTKFSGSFFKFKKLTTKYFLVSSFKHLAEIFQTIKYENHVVLLQPRLHSINSIKA